MSEFKAFIRRALEGDIVDPDTEIDDAIDDWHEGGTEMELHEWLGMSLEEYGLFVERPEALRFVIAAHHSNRDVFDLIQIADSDECLALAARGASREDLDSIRKWLNDTHRI